MSKPKINVLEFIPIGRKNAISMPELTLRLGLKNDTRTARKLVFEARRNGAVICSTTCSGDKAAGYYQPGNIAEVRPYIAMQEHRISSAKAALKSAKKFAKAAKAGDSNG